MEKRRLLAQLRPQQLRRIVAFVMAPAFHDYRNRKMVQCAEGLRFIQPDDGSQDVFVHLSAVERSGIGNLVEGQKVSFELERGDRGKTSAVNLSQG
jgi:CspA family cold shock protein